MAETYLAQYDAAAPEDQFPLVRRWIDDDPLTFFAELRDRRPALVTSVCTLVTRFDDVTEILGMPSIFTTALYLPKMGDGIYLMAHDDDALHTREKSLMQGLLNRDDLPRVRAMVARTGKGILDAAGGRLEAIANYCRLVPATLVRDYFGLTGVDRRKLIEWSYWNQADTFYNQPFDLISDDKRRWISQRHDETGKELGTYVAELIVRRLAVVKAEQPWHWLLSSWHILKTAVGKLRGRKSEPISDDIVTRMVRTAYPAAVDFDIKRVGINAGGLLIGAIETTSQAVAQVIQYLLSDRFLWQEATRTAPLDNPAQFDAIVWEALRFVPISSYIFRKASCDYTIASGTDHATRIKAGTLVLAVTQSAMFDPRAFDQPDRFMPGRNWYRSFHFGFGSHECLGKYVGMVMIPEMVRQVVLRPGLDADGKIDYQGGHLPQIYNLHWRP